MHDDAGYSLVELLVTMIVMIIVMIAIYGIWNALERSYLFAEDDIRAQDEARLAVSEMVEYIRTARQPSSVSDQSLNAVIPKADLHEIWVWTDIDRDPTEPADDQLELVRFMVDYDPVAEEPYLIRQESTSGDGNFDGSPVRVVNQNVRNVAFDSGGALIRDAAQTTPVFRYYDLNGVEMDTPVDDPTSIREITIELHVDIDPARQPYYHSIKTTVQPRNLRQY